MFLCMFGVYLRMLLSNQVNETNSFVHNETLNKYRRGSRNPVTLWQFLLNYVSTVLTAIPRYIYVVELFQTLDECYLVTKLLSRNTHNSCRQLSYHPRLHTIFSDCRLHLLLVRLLHNGLSTYDDKFLLVLNGVCHNPGSV